MTFNLYRKKLYISLYKVLDYYKRKLKVIAGVKSEDVRLRPYEDSDTK